MRAFVAAEYPRLVAALTLVAGSRAIAEDAVQEALVRAWEREERGHPLDPIAPWVTRVALNLLYSGFRRLRVERRHARDVFTAGAPPEDLVDLRRALDALPRRQRQAVVLRYLLDFTTAEVAEAMRVREGTVKSQLHRARQTLASALGEDELEEANDRA